MDNILEKFKKVKWETLGRWDSSILHLPLSQQHMIEKNYARETERKREGVKYWLWNNPYASWRWLITQVDKQKEHAVVADQIRGYAEKLTGMLELQVRVQFVRNIKYVSPTVHIIVSKLTTTK